MLWFLEGFWCFDDSMHGEWTDYGRLGLQDYRRGPAYYVQDVMD